MDSGIPSLPTPPSRLPTSSSSLPPRPHPFQPNQRPHQPTQHLQQTFSTRPRPPPARQGAPASSRNFAQSSAGGASSHLGFAPSPTPSGGGGGGLTPAAAPGNGSPSPRGLGRGAGAGGAGRGGLGARGGGDEEEGQQKKDVVLTEAQRNKCDRWGESYTPAEETIRNDYSSRYVQSGARPQNHLRNTAVETRFAEYPKLALLLTYKHQLLSSPSHSIPPTYFNLSSLPPLPSPPLSPLPPNLPLTPPSTMQRALSTLHPSRFDVILLTPPLSISFEELAALDIGRAAATPGFVWLWVGSGQTGAGAGKGGEAGQGGENVGGGVGLEKGRELLSLWGYRRCEDIVWLKTNKRDPEGDLAKDPSPLFTSTVEHCLMGIRGTVRRSTDSSIVHCNVDTDVVVWEGDEEDPHLKPPEVQSLIENFCLGTRRLHLYGSPHSLRRGWLTVSAPPPPSPSPSSPSSFAAPQTMPKAMYSPSSIPQLVEKEGTRAEQDVKWGKPREWERHEWEARWRRQFVGAGGVGGVGGAGEQDGGVVRVESLLPFVEELDALRPKSPPPRNGVPSSGGLGRGRGAGLGITRSGLVSQASSYPSSGTSSPASGGIGRGRGRGNGVLGGPAGPGGAGLIPPPPPPPMGMPYPNTIGTPPVHPGSAPPFPHQPQHGFVPNGQAFPPQQHLQQQGYNTHTPPAPSFYPQQPHQQHGHFSPHPSPYTHHPNFGAPSPYATVPTPEQFLSPVPTPAGLPPPPPFVTGYPPHLGSPLSVTSALPPPPPPPSFPLPPLSHASSTEHLSTLFSSTLQFPPSFPPSASPSLSPALMPYSNHGLPRMASSTSLAASSYGDGTSVYGGVGADGEIVYPISSRRTSLSASGGVGGGVGRY
ncbi:hypothetical protein JCM8547_006610 [Rhodosporidiobolus lusitaniae]